MVHLAERAEKVTMIKDMQYRIGGSLLPAVMPRRIGIEERWDMVTLFISVKGGANASIRTTHRDSLRCSVLCWHGLLLALPPNRRHRRILRRVAGELGRQVEVGIRRKQRNRDDRAA